MIRFLTALLVCTAGTAQAQTLDFPSNASLQVEMTSVADSYQLPVGIWDRGQMPLQTVEGHVVRQAWRIEAPSLTLLQLVRPLREQLLNDRYRILFECQTEACGGFDFRFGTETLPPPEMQINIGDFRFLAAEKTGAEGPEYISLFVSRTAQAGFVQIVHVGPFAQVDEPVATAAAPAMRGMSALQSASIVDQLDSVGRAILVELTFETGSAQLGAGDFPSLQALADYLSFYPDRTVALVGHTDSSGSLDANIALSKRRAASVAERLTTDYGVDRRQLEAEGMGYLAPIASNLSQEGREANRRVEVIITSTGE